MKIKFLVISLYFLVFTDFVRGVFDFNYKKVQHQSETKLLKKFFGGYDVQKFSVCKTKNSLKSNCINNPDKDLGGVKGNKSSNTATFLSLEKRKNKKKKLKNSIYQEQTSSAQPFDHEGVKQNPSSFMTYGVAAGSIAVLSGLHMYEHGCVPECTIL